MRQLLLTKKIMAVVMLALAMSLKVKAADAFIVFEPASGAWELSDPSICIAEGEHSCVRLAAANLATDFGKVIGTEATITSHLSPLTSKSILIGTVGANKQIDQWVKQGVLRDLKGKTEKYIIKTIGNQLVIAGSDKRGTVYGIYELSRQIGVSPWYYWADVPVEKHTSLYIKEGEYTDGEPAVRYRGLFLNDEAPCLTTWVKNTFGTDFGGHKFYEKVFELILRLKGHGGDDGYLAP